MKEVYINDIDKDIKYEYSDTKERQGNRERIDPDLKDGYSIKEHRNGYWVLVKPVRVNVFFTDSEGKRFEKPLNMKQNIIEFYGKRRISPEQVENVFKKDVKNGNIIFQISQDNKMCTMTRK